MAHFPTKQSLLLQKLDLIITTYGSTNPELTKDLLSIRDELVRTNTSQNVVEYTKVALKLSALIKFIFDHLPPPH